MAKCNQLTPLPCKGLMGAPTACDNWCIRPHCTGQHQPSLLITARRCRGMNLWVQATAARSTGESIADNFCQIFAKCHYRYRRYFLYRRRYLQVSLTLLVLLWTRMSFSGRKCASFQWQREGGWRGAFAPGGTVQGAAFRGPKYVILKFGRLWSIGVCIADSDILYPLTPP